MHLTGTYTLKITSSEQLENQDFYFVMITLSSSALQSGLGTNAQLISLTNKNSFHTLLLRR